MTDDILKAASQALRELGDEQGQAERFTRARVMASLHQRRQRRSTRLALFVPLAAILVGSTAWAGATGRLGRVWTYVSDAVVEAVGDPPGGTEAAAPVAHRGRRAAAPESSSAAPSPEVSPTEDPAQLPEDEVEPDEQEAQPQRAARGAGGRGSAGPRGGRHSAEPSAASAGPESPDALGLYRAAHRAHFGGGDPAAALRAWDTYLRADPSGRFSVEARYNRGICLVRLGRLLEARAALSPFARGAYGGYRQREASELLEALGDTAP